MCLWARATRQEAARLGFEGCGPRAEPLDEEAVRLEQWLQEAVGTGSNGRAFVDSAPVMDKAWARRSGLGGRASTRTSSAARA